MHNIFATKIDKIHGSIRMIFLAPFTFRRAPFRTGMTVAFILWLFHSCISVVLGAGNLSV